MCVGVSIYMQLLHNKYLPSLVHGGWTPWTEWSDCSVSCSNGTQSRTRSCTNPAPAHGGRDCEGEDRQVKDCFLRHCPGELNRLYARSWPYAIYLKRLKRELVAVVLVELILCDDFVCSFVTVDCVWLAWSGWGECSKECGGGQQFRSRDQLVEKYGGAPCEGLATEPRDCNTHPCPSKSHSHTLTPSHLHIITPAHLTKLHPYITLTPSHMHTVNGGWSDWTDWTPCSVTCATGLQSRGRACNNPPPQFGGLDCDGETSEERECFERHCPIDCQWLAYSDWSPCSKSCDNGTSERVRDFVSAQHGGDECEGDKKEVVLCNPQACPGNSLRARRMQGCMSSMPSHYLCSCSN